MTGRSPEEEAMLAIDDEIQEAIEAISAEWGPAIGAQPVSEQRERALWWQRDDRVDPDAMSMLLQTQGLAPELLDPESPGALAIVKAHPEMAQLYAQAVAPDVADTLVRLAEWPNRLAIMVHYEDDPPAAVRKANRLDRKGPPDQSGRVAPESPVGAASPASTLDVLPEAEVAPGDLPMPADMMGG